MSDALALAEAQLHGTGLPQPVLRANLLLNHVLATWRGLKPPLDADVKLEAEEAARLSHLLERHLPVAPVQLLREPIRFGELELQGHSASFFTRVDTEQLLDSVWAKLREREAGLLYDVGTGIGSVLLALLKRLPKWEGVGFDIGMKGLVMAGLNHRDRYPALQARFELNDLLADVETPADAIVAVLPYGTTDYLEKQSRESVGLELMGMLHGGADGLDLLRRFIPQAAGLTKLLFLEVAPVQAEPVEALLRDVGFTEVSITKDFLGQPRFLTAER